MLHRLSRVFSLAILATAAVAFVLGAWSVFTDGFRVYLLGIPLSVRGAARTLGVSGLLFAVAWALPESRRLLRSYTTRLSSSRASMTLCAALAVFVLAVGMANGSRAAGGADSSGYLNQARGWLTGDVRPLREPLPGAPWPNVEWSLTPLGYVPSGERFVPVYAPGTPLLMALLAAVLGACGPYLLGPLSAAALVAVTFALGRRVHGVAVGTAAAMTLVCSPTVVMMMASNMSDMPAAALWSAALLAATGERRWNALLSGVLTGTALVVRPNLVLLAVFPALLLVRSLRAVPYRRLLLFASGCAPAIVFVAWYYDTMFGSPFRSGYGSTAALYSVSNVGINLSHYAEWVWRTQGPLVLIALAAPLVRQRRGADRLAVVLAGFVGIVVLSYVFYKPFEAWWFLRFLLPAFGVASVLAMATVATGAERVKPGSGWVAVLAVSVMTVVASTQSRAFEEARAVNDIEQRYADIGRYVDANLPRSAVVIATQHSGSIRFYSGRQILSYQGLDAAWMDRAIEYLRQLGRPVYAVLDPWEVQLFREKFAGQSAVSLLDTSPVAIASGETAIFDFSGSERRSSTSRIPIMRACEPLRRSPR